MDPASKVDAKVQHPVRARRRNGRSEMNPLSADSEEEGEEPENEGEKEGTQAPASRGRKRTSRILHAPSESEKERGEPSIDIKSIPEEVKPPEAEGRKRRPRTQPEPKRDVAAADAVSISRRETRSKTKTVVEVARQEKPKKRGRQLVKEEEAHVAQTKRARGAVVKGDADTEILKEESEPFVDEPKRRGGKDSVKKSTEAAPDTTRRSARARVATVEDEVRDVKGEPKSVDRRSRRQSENTDPEERQTRKRGRFAVEDNDQEPAALQTKKLTRGRQSKASSEPDVKEKHENQPHTRTTRGSGKEAHDESPASTRQSAVVRTAENDSVKEGVQKVGTQRRKTRGVQKETDSVTPASGDGRRNAAAPGPNSLQLAKEEGGELQSRKTRVSSKKKAVAPIEETIVSTRRSARERKPVSKT